MLKTSSNKKWWNFSLFLNFSSSFDYIFLEMFHADWANILGDTLKKFRRYWERFPSLY